MTIEAGNRVEDIAIAQAELNQAEAQLADARAGSLQDEIAQAEASLRANQADLQLAIARVRRYQLLREEGAISQDDFEEYLQDERRLEALVDEARRRIRQLEQNQQSQVEQLAAIVEQRRQNLRRLQNGPRLEDIAAARAEVEEIRSNLDELINGTRPEDIAAARAEVRQAEAQVQQIQTQLNNTSIRAPFPGIVATRQVNPGQTVRVDLMETVSTEGFWLPTAALSQGIRGLWTCYVLTQTDDSSSGVYQVQQHAVEIIHEQSDRVLVRGTLQPGDRIVASGTNRLVPGQNVQPFEEISQL